MKLTKIIASILALAAFVTVFAACSKKDGSADATTVKLGVVGSIYEDLWQPAKDSLKEEGIDLEIVQFSDYVTPNNALNGGDIDLNAFQHRIYLEKELEQYNYDIELIGYTFIIPLNLYSNKVSSVDEIKDGDVVAIPDDVTNGGRAIKVLAASGLITLKDGVGFNPTLDDIETYNVGIEIKELSANTLPSVLDDVTAAVINGNYALDFGLKTEQAIYKDTVLNEENYWNLIAARSADLEDPAKVEVYKKVVAAFQSDATEKVFNETFGGYFIKVGWDQDLLADK
ncbi:MAG: MetQ/NlpA family ABC transporter substrate-binding protein [Eubacteriales bacterium]